MNDLESIYLIKLKVSINITVVLLVYMLMTNLSGFTVGDWWERQDDPVRVEKTGVQGPTPQQVKVPETNKLALTMIIICYFSFNEFTYIVFN